MKEILSTNDYEILNNIETGKILGASNQMMWLNKIFVNISKNPKIDKKKRLESILFLINNFVERRGKSSYAIVNEYNYILSKINEMNIEEIEVDFELIIEDYYNNINKKMDKILEYSNELLKNSSTIMVFDYSSTIEKVICNLPKMRIIIPESRTINGGYPFVKGLLEKGHSIHFIPDVSMLVYLKSVDAVLIGVETYYPDGTAFNTIGSDILALLCHEYNVPFYAITQTSKLDPRARFGVFKREIKKNLKNKLVSEWSDTSLSEKIDFESIELVGVSPKFITSFITEYGIIPPNSMFSLGEGKKHEE